MDDSTPSAPTAGPRDAAMGAAYNNNNMLTSTTAPGKFFSSRAELANHYKSDWHKYNLKRREANLPMLGESDFNARWEAALALRKEKQAQQSDKGSHLKKGKRKNNVHNANNNGATTFQSQQSTSTSTATTPASNAASSGDNGTSNDALPAQQTNANAFPINSSPSVTQENPVIEPTQCLFDSHTSESLQQNVDYMHKNYGFFIPDQECLVDLEGLLGYCHEKIKLGHYCLYCEKIFSTWQGCQKHMITKQHTKLRYEKGYWEELDIFYDFTKDDKSFIIPSDEHDAPDAQENSNQNDIDMAADADNDGHNDGGDDEWEDMSDDDNEAGNDNQDDLFDGYEKEIARFGLDVTPLGELVFPDGRIVGHRALRKYYKQRIRPKPLASGNAAVLAAIDAAGERMYEGRVIQLKQKGHVPLGVGNGILVRQNESTAAVGFSALSLYRLRAAVMKQRRDDDKGHRLKLRTTTNINKMDKKANRLMNGVSVAHAAR